jgi:hypothetical protein
MNSLRDLINKLGVIAEAPADPQRAAYDQFKADDAKTAAIEQVKKYASIPLNQIPRLANAIDPKTGIIYYGEPGGEGGGDSSPRKMPLRFMSQPDQKPMVDALTLAGLKVVPHEEKQLFGTGQYAKVEPAALQQVLAGPVAPTKPEGAAKPTGPDTSATNDSVKKELLAKLQAAVQALQAAMSAPTPAIKEHHLSVARNLMESFGYNTYEGFNDTIQKGGWTAPPVSNVDMSSGNTLTKQGEFGSVGKAAAERRAAQEAERLAAQKAASTAATNVAAPVAKVAQQAGINAGEKAVAGAAKTGALKTGGKMLGKLIPGVGLAFGAKDAYDRYNKGDYFGAGLAGLSGLSSLVPGIGTAGALALDAANLARDYKAGRFDEPEQGAQATQAPTSSDSKVLLLQKNLIAAGANIKADGVMGPATQAAMKQYPAALKGYPWMTGLKEGIKTLQERLALIEAKGKIRSSLDSEYLWDDQGSVYTTEGEQVTDPLTLSVIWESVTEKDTTIQLDEFAGQLLKGAWNLGKGAVGGAGNFLGGTVRGAGQVAKGGKNASAAVTQVANKAGGAKGAGLKAGAAMARNPIKTALGATALGGLAGMGLPASPTDKPAVDNPTDKPITNKPITNKPTGPEQGGMDTDLSALIQAVKDAMMPLADMDPDANDSEISPALTDARLLLTMAEKSGSEQAKVDANSAADAKVKASTQPTAAPAVAPKPAGGNGPEQSAMPSTEKRTPAQVAANNDLRKSGLEESDNELARWLKIARG